MPKPYNLYVIDSGLTGPVTAQAPQGELRAAALKAIQRLEGVPRPDINTLSSFQQFRKLLQDRSTPQAIARYGRIKDLTIIAHGEGKSFQLGGKDIEDGDIYEIGRPYEGFADHASVHIIRCSGSGILAQHLKEDARVGRQDLYRAMASQLLPRGGKVTGTADDVELSLGGGAMLVRYMGAQGYKPVGGKYPTTYHSLGLLKQKPQESFGWTNHTLRQGDRVWYLADDYGFSNRQGFTTDVQDLNPGIDFNRLRAGQTIRVPTRVGKPAILSTPYALRSQQAARPPQVGFGTQPPAYRSTLQVLSDQLRRTPAPPPRPPTFDTMSTLRRMETDAFEAQRRNRWLQGISRGLERRPVQPVPALRPQVGTSTLRRLSEQLDRTPFAPRPLPAANTIDLLKRMEVEARDRQQTNRWLQNLSNQYRRPPTPIRTGNAYPNTLQMLNQHLKRFR